MGGCVLTDQLNAMTPHHLPFYIVKPGETDVLMIVTGIFLVLALLGVGNIYLKLHSLPERMAHKSKKILLDLIALLCLLALLTHEHLFWFAAIVLAFIDIPDFLSQVNRIARSVETMAGQDVGDKPDDHRSVSSSPEVTLADKPGPKKEVSHV